MIIFGTRGVTTTPNRGVFQCPSCGSEQPYRHKRVRNFFSLYFIPIIPLGVAGEYIECESCKGQYELGVLEYDPGAEADDLEVAYHALLLRAMAAMSLEDGDIDEAEIETVRTVYGQMAEIDMPAAAVRQMAGEVREDQRHITEYVAEFAGSLKTNGKEKIIKALFLVAGADGNVSDDELALLSEVAAALEMSEMHVRGILETLREEG